MNGLPPDSNLTPLVGCVADQLRFGRHQVQVLLGSTAVIASEARIKLETPRGAEVETDDYAGVASQLCELLGVPISAAERTEGGGLRVSFETGHVLTFHVDSGGFESFQVRIGKETIVG